MTLVMCFVFVVDFILSAYPCVVGGVPKLVCHTLTIDSSSKSRTINSSLALLGFLGAEFLLIGLLEDDFYIAINLFYYKKSNTIKTSLVWFKIVTRTNHISDPARILNDNQKTRNIFTLNTVRKVNWVWKFSNWFSSFLDSFSSLQMLQNSIYTLL